MYFNIDRFFNNTFDYDDRSMYTSFLNIKWINSKIEHHGEFNKRCVIVIPVYRPTPKNDEAESLKQVVKILGNKYELVLVCPFEFDTNVYNKCANYNFSVLRCSKEYFKSQKSYSNLCEEWKFYDAFNEYEYMIIYQLDAWIFNDNIEYFLNLGYDYIGGPHLVGYKGRTQGENGNGGFCLRKIRKFIDVCKKTDFSRYAPLEDCVFTQNLKKEFNLAPLDICRQFSWQDAPQINFRLNGNKLPMGCHAFKKFSWSFWKNYIKIVEVPTQNEIKRHDRIVNLVENIYNGSIKPQQPRVMYKNNIIRKFR